MSSWLFGLTFRSKLLHEALHYKCLKPIWWYFEAIPEDICQKIRELHSLTQTAQGRIKDLRQKEVNFYGEKRDSTAAR
jgi:hypothetical protein